MSFEGGEESVDLDDIDLANIEVDPETGEIKPAAKPELFQPQDAKPQVRFSVSLIEDYAACPAKAYARITKQPSTKSLALVLGSAVHNSIEQLLKYRRNPKDTYLAAFELECEKNQLVSTSEEAQKKKLEGDKMLGAAYTILSKEGQDGKPFYEKVDPTLVERFFRIERQGRVYTGKFDLLHFSSPGDYAIIDFKTNKTLPNQETLDKKLQFSLYSWAASADPAMPTYGLWPSRSVWLHLRGKNVARNESGKAERKEALKEYKYSFPTTRTPEEVERVFNDTVEPIAEQIEQGRWYRTEGEQCGWCQYYDRAKGRCGVTLPQRQKIHAEMEVKSP